MLKFLIDTDVIIDYLRGSDLAKHWFDQLKGKLYLASITVAELHAGVKEGQEREVLDNFIDLFSVVSIDTDIAIKGGLFRRDYVRSHNIGLADALIAASTQSVSAILVTRNKKHFPMLSAKKILVPYQMK